MKRYQDNLSYSFYNRNYILQSIQRNSEKKKREDNNRVILNYGVNKNVNNNIYEGYINYINGEPRTLVYEDEPLRSFVRNQGVNNRNDRLTQSVKSVKDVGGYKIPYADLPKTTLKATYGQRVKGII